MLKSSNINTSYLVVTKYNQLPVITENQTIFDSFDFYCTNKLYTVQSYEVFMSNLNKKYNNIENSTVGIGIRELSKDEEIIYCSKNFVNNLPEPPKLDSNFQLNNDIETVLIAKSCYYLNKKNEQWQTDGLITVDDLNLTHTTCLSNHLTDFSAAQVVLPPSIDFGFVIKNSSFEKNPTVYATLIVFVTLYIILFAWCRYMDRKDKFKSNIYLLDDNPIDGTYFYEVIVFTGNRKDSGTNSKVFLSLCGSLNETLNRNLNNESNKIKVLQRGSVDTFIMSVDRLDFLLFIFISLFMICVNLFKIIRQ